MKKKSLHLVYLCTIIMLLVSCTQNNTINSSSTDSASITISQSDSELEQSNNTSSLNLDNIKLAKDYDHMELSDSFESVKYGMYEQDNNLDNGKEDIEWIVLDKSNNQLLLLSKYILDNVPYNEKNGFIVWKESTLRNWLNTSFYDSTFNEEEKSAILRKNYNNHSISYRSFDVKAEPKVELNTTDDLVSLIGYYDIIKYMGNLYDNIDTPVENRRIVAKSTPYAQREIGIYKIGLTVEKSNVWYKGCSPYWLRTTYLNDNTHGLDADAVSIVDADASISFAQYDDSYTGVRPMILVDVSKLSNDKLNSMLSYNPNESFYIPKEQNNDNSNQLNNNWEMKFYAECIDMFKEKFNSDKINYSHVNKYLYIPETDGSIVFTYGLRDLDNDGIKEFLVFNKTNLVTVYTLANDYYQDYEKYAEMYYPNQTYEMFLFDDDVDERTSFLHEDNIIELRSIRNNNASFFYQAFFIDKNDDFGYGTKEDFSYETNSLDGLGEYSYIVNGEYVDKRISKAEADAIFASHGQIVVLNEGSFVIR